jgi:hypothetical protein
MIQKIGSHEFIGIYRRPKPGFSGKKHIKQNNFLT